jgi:hypothetical protein
MLTFPAHGTNQKVLSWHPWEFPRGEHHHGKGAFPAIDITLDHHVRCLADQRLSEATGRPSTRPECTAQNRRSRTDSGYCPPEIGARAGRAFRHVRLAGAGSRIEPQRLIPEDTSDALRRGRRAPAFTEPRLPDGAGS